MLGYNHITARADGGGGVVITDRITELFLAGRYSSRISQLHGACFYDGICNEETERRIRETAAYIRDANNLAYDGLLSV